jgi:hypothetical protein
MLPFKQRGACAHTILPDTLVGVTRNYPYPPDEFDRAGADAPVGVHRATRSAWSGALPFVIIGVVAVIVAIGAVRLLSNDTTSPDDPGTATNVANGTTTPQSPPPSPTQTIDETPTDVVTEPEVTPTDPGPTAPDIEALVANATLDAVIRVVNASSTAGQESQAQQALASWGFTGVVTEAPGPGSAAGQNDTLVFYEAGMQETALAVAAILGVPAVQVIQPSEGVRDPAVVSVLVVTDLSITQQGAQ